MDGIGDQELGTGDRSLGADNIFSLPQDAEELLLQCPDMWGRLGIEDDGHGFSREQALQDRLGLGIMGERAETIAATPEVDSHPGQGTTVLVLWPFDIDETRRPPKLGHELTR